jgi:putative ABC transport system permease protein
MKQFIRNFNRQKVVGLFNISSLSLGIMAAIVVGLWAINEYSFDGFHRNADNIYRLTTQIFINGNPTRSGSTYRPFGEEARAELPAIEDMSRILTVDGDIGIGETNYPAVDVFVVDKNFFTFFSFPLREGDPATVLSAPDGVVISESAARRYFPGQNAMGQRLHFDRSPFTVSGIMADMPGNSSFRSDIIFPMFGYYADERWLNRDFYYTFFTLPPGAGLKQVEESLTGILYRNAEVFREMGAKVTLEPLKDVHFSADSFVRAGVVQGSRSLVVVLASVAFVILIISCINFINLFISTSFLRARSIGIKKAHGAGRGRLIADFYTETAVYVLISIGLGVFLAHLALPLFNSFTQGSIAIDLLSPRLYAFLAVLFAFTVLLAGTFPALYLTRFNPVETLSGTFRGKRISVFQRSLIVIQFSASIALLITVSFMQQQVRLMISHDLGFEKENVIYMQRHGDFGRNYETFRDEMLKYPSIRDVTMKNSLPTRWQNGWGFSREGSDEVIIMEINDVKPNYFELMGMEIIDGENPFYLESTDSIIPVIINERAAGLLGLESPVGRTIVVNRQGRMVVKGVLRNTHVRSLRDEVDPQIYQKMTWVGGWFPLFFKITGDPQQAIDLLRTKWEASAAGYPFEYHFLDDTYRELYASETNAGRVLAFAMLITFVISTAGLFAMAFYVTRRRMREIALRKVNGATLSDLLVLLNRDFVLWVLLSFLIASPVAYFGVQSWLDGFTVKTPLSIWIFLLTGLVALLVALLTTSVQTWKVATTNPVKMLRGE